MSNAMSRSKSRWKGALLAGAAIAVISPLAANAQTGLSVSITANPLAGTSPNNYTGKSNVYIDPYDADTLYVYATVTGAAVPSASYVDGLQYVYFNVNAVASGPNASGGTFGTISAATPSALFGGGSFNQTIGLANGSGSSGAQGGALGTISSTPSVVVGTNNGSLGSIAKPRADAFVYDTGASNGSNIVVSGNSVSFLVETLTYTPNSTYVAQNPSTNGSANGLQFNISTPSSSLFATGNASSPYFSTNYAVGLGSQPTLGSSPGAINTGNGVFNAATGTYTASTSNLNLNNAIPGDANLDGTVNGTDFITLGNDFGNTGQTWNQGDFNGDGTVNGTDFIVLGNNFGATLGSGPSGLAGTTAAIAGGSSSVPEPVGISLVVLGATALRRRRRPIG